MEVIGITFAAVLGMAWGSLATMAVYRMPRGEPWIGRKPFCPLCSHDLGFFDYISIFSYILRRGKCKYCQGKYELRYSYLFTEILITAIFIAAYLQYNLSEKFILITGFGICATIMMAIEFEHKKILEKNLLSLFILGIAYRIYVDQTIYGAIFAIAAGFILAIITRHGFFAIKGKFKESYDYLEYKPEDRFKGKYFELVKLSAIISLWLPLNLFLIVFAISLFLQIILQRLKLPGSIFLIVMLSFLIFY